MNYLSLGNSGLKVSEQCLGAMTFGRESSREDSFRMLDLYKEAGGSFIDSANVYSRGGSEALVGEWLKRQRREDFAVTTKVRFPMGEGPNDQGLGRKHIRASVEASLQRLQTDYIDILFVHCWDPHTPLEETLSTLNDLVREGKVRYLGASNFSGSQLQKALDISRHRGWEPFSALQAKYNLLTRSTEWELLPLCRREGLGFMAWGPLLGGWLSGRYRRGMEKPPENSRVEQAEKEGWFESWSRYATEHTWRVTDALIAASEEMNRSPAQTALLWLQAQPGVTCPIIGARKIRHLEDNLKAAGGSLPPEAVEKLNRASAAEMPYPYDFLQTMNGQLE